jgi:type 1 glutamine amidotransferase
MKKLAPLLIALLALSTVSSQAATKATRVLLITGGHAYDTNEFHALFAANSSIQVTHVIHPEAQAWFRPGKAANFDVIVAYDMWKTISDNARTNLLQFVRQGKGLLALHHSLASFPDWPEYSNLIGGQYHDTPWKLNGRDMPPSTYEHDMEVEVEIVDPHHPVTQGLRNFTIHDEVYGGFEVKPDAQPLLRTSHPKSGPVLAWHRQEGAGRVVYLQLGHDHQAYAHPAFQQLISQAINYVTPKH